MRLRCIRGRDHRGSCDYHDVTSLEVFDCCGLTPGAAAASGRREVEMQVGGRSSIAWKAPSWTDYAERFWGPAGTPLPAPPRMTYAELPPEPPLDPDDLARSLATAAGAEPWDELPEVSRQDWRAAAEVIRGEHRAGRIDIADQQAMRRAVADAFDQVVDRARDRTIAELEAARAIEWRVACRAAVDLLVAIVRACCRAAAGGMLELDLADRQRPVPAATTDPERDDTAARFGQLEMD